MSQTPEEIEQFKKEKLALEFKSKYRTPSELLKSHCNYHKDTAEEIIKKEKIKSEFKVKNKTPIELVESRYHFHKEAAQGILKEVRDSKARCKEGTRELYDLHKQYEDMFASAIDCLTR